MKKLILALSILALSGCSSRQLIPVVAGGVVGYALGSSNNTVVVRQPAPVVDRTVVITESCALVMLRMVKKNRVCVVYISVKWKNSAAEKTKHIAKV